MKKEEKLEEAVDCLAAKGYDVLSFSTDRDSVTLFDGKFYLDIRVTEWEGEDA